MMAERQENEAEINDLNSEVSELNSEVIIHFNSFFIFYKTHLFSISHFLRPNFILLLD